jgi:hypothetical protein
MRHIPTTCGEHIRCALPESPSQQHQHPPPRPIAACPHSLPPAPLPFSLPFFLAAQEILSEYLSLFSFTGMALDEALR